MTPFVQIDATIFLVVAVGGSVTGVLLGAVSLGRGLFKELDDNKRFLKTASACGLTLGALGVIIIIAVFGAGAGSYIWGVYYY